MEKWFEEDFEPDFGSHMRISYKERHMTNWRHVYFPSGFVYVVLREKIFLS